jgi:hypothetical protein
MGVGIMRDQTLKQEDPKGLWKPLFIVIVDVQVTYVYYESMKRKLKIKPIYECRTGTPKDKDEVNKRELGECEGWVWDLDAIGAPSRLRLMCKTVALTRVRPTLLLNPEEKAVRRKWNMSRCVCAGWTPETEKKRSVSRWVCKNKSLTNSLCNRSDVLPIGVINDTTLGDLLL